ncbi:hypothetical protein [Alicyclobacillus sp.]|uniref:hypothetical protein n=1 Tax=Alicyclobacillus sp. TaxID=61169 RepID=UPI0025C1C974|nr:hypothetical protein [Alicyclobacillus sp.]MCL6516295.1 hypothetical protein [Alicyclobacillus sp.]
MSYTASWIGHILAGLLGTLLSVSIFYKTLERWFAVHRKLDGARVKTVIDPAGRPLTPAELETFIRQFNEAPFLGVNRREAGPLTDAWRVELTDGQTLWVASGDRFVEVKRVGGRGKTRRYWLLDMPMVTGRESGGAR